MHNIIYCFTGTGNSLEAAQDIARTLGNTEVYPMNKESGLALKETRFDRIGFVFPVYFGGLPAHVIKFLEKLDFGVNKESYLFTVGTYGGIPANALRQAGKILETKNVSIDYGSFIRMADNYILMYDSGKDQSKIQHKYSELIPGIARDILKKNRQPVKKSINIVLRYNRYMLKKLPAKAAHYSASDLCNGCGVCRDICPAGNISLKEGTPVFDDKCQSCVGCIQYCPQKALNYKESTQKRGRYRNPNYTAGDLIRFQHKTWQPAVSEAPV